MAFNMNKCKVMYVGRNNINCKYYMNDLNIDSINEEKEMKVVTSTDLLRFG